MMSFGYNPCGNKTQILYSIITGFITLFFSKVIKFEIDEKNMTQTEIYKPVITIHMPW